MLRRITYSKTYFLLTLIVLTQGVFYLKFAALILLIPYIKEGISGDHFKIDSIAAFYLILPIIGILSYLTQILAEGLAPKAVILVAASLSFWIIYFLVYVVSKYWIRKVSFETIDWVLMSFFKINLLFCGFEYLLMVIEYKNINPFLTELATSAGDNIKGLLANSSANMVVNSFFLLYLLITKKPLHLLLAAILVILFTTYMSGILCFAVAISFHFLFNRKISLRIRLASLTGLLLMAGILFIVSYNNILYAAGIIESVFSLSPPRKIVSFTETYEQLFSGVRSFLIGASPAHFSSRIAFIGGGEFVSWYPETLAYTSTLFQKYHFQHWNNDILSIPFSDGTANQPFSVYNQLLGEYGILGMGSFLLLYVRGISKKLKGNSFRLLFLISIFLYMLLDYWFEYLVSMILIELLVLTIEKYQQNEARSVLPKGNIH